MKNKELKITYQKVIPADFTPDTDGAFDILFAETLKDWKPKIGESKQAQNGYCNVLQSNIT